MGFPSKNELKRIRKLLEKVEPSRLLPENASKADKVKYLLCQKFVRFIMDENITPLQLARKIKIHPGSMNKIVKYRIDFFSIDKLMELADRVGFKYEVKVI